MIKRYNQFINESDEPNQDLSPDGPKYTELKDEIKSMIEKTIENNGGEFEDFKDKFVKSPEDVKIEGLINDSDIYEFYLKYRNDIDELLNDIKFFDEVPSESNTFVVINVFISFQYFCSIWLRAD